MIRTRKSDPASGIIILFFALVNTIAIRDGYIGNGNCYLVLIPALPLLLLAIDHKLKYYEKRK
jgi:hypothetical protein